MDLMSGSIIIGKPKVPQRMARKEDIQPSRKDEEMILHIEKLNRNMDGLSNLDYLKTVEFEYKAAWDERIRWWKGRTNSGKMSIQDGSKRQPDLLPWLNTREEWKCLYPTKWQIPTKADRRAVTFATPMAMSKLARQGISEHSSREGNETSEVEPRGRTDECNHNHSHLHNHNNNYEFEQQQQGEAAGTGSSGEGNGSSRVDNKRKADGERQEDPEREDGKCTRTEGNKRKTIEAEEESMLRKIVKYLMTLQRTEAKKQFVETLEVVELVELK